MKLRPMSPSEFNLWKKNSIDLFAKDKMKSHELTQESALLIADNSFKRLLPNDLETKDAYLLSGTDEDQNLIGHIWFNITTEGNHKRAFIYDLIIEEKYRSKGFGKKLMLLAEEEMKKLGVVRVGLHAFSSNKNAINLYQRLGYIETDINMEKDLTKITSSIIPTFETKRSILRAITLNDVPTWKKNFVDYEVIKFLSNNVPWPYPDDGIETFIQNVLLPNQGNGQWYWGITLKNNPQEIIGGIDLRREARLDSNRGFWLGKKYWSQGIMTEAIKPVMDYAFEVLKFEKLQLSNAVGNTGSRRVKEKTGAKFIEIKAGQFVEPSFKEKEVWELSKIDWQKNNRPSFIGNYKDFIEEDNSHYKGSKELLGIGCPIGRILGLKKIGIHIETLLPQRRTSWPHAESLEEEFVFVLEGNPDAWIDGNLYSLSKGDFVAFPSGTGIAHTVINNTNQNVLLLVGGETTKADNKVFNPLHPKRNEEIKLKGLLWENPPKRELGPHNGLPTGVRK